MDNIGDILSSLSDEDMKALGDAARSLLGSSEQEQGQNDSDRGFSMDPATMAKIAQIMSAMNRHDSRCDLIAALRPLLSEPRRRRADDAMQLIKLIDLLPMIEDLGEEMVMPAYTENELARMRKGAIASAREMQRRAAIKGGEQRQCNRPNPPPTVPSRSKAAGANVEAARKAA